MKSGTKLILIFTGLLLLALFTLGRCLQLPVDLAKAVSRTFVDAFQVQPEVRINQVTVYGQSAPVAELAILTKEQLVEYTYKHEITFQQKSLPFTGKLIRVRAVYRMKAGFDLHQPFTVQIDSTTKRIAASLPPAQILSVERVGDLQYEDQDSFFNSITSAEREKVLNEVEAYARQQAVASGILKETERQAGERLQELMEKNGQKIIFGFRLSP
jgi:hypothetical protein